MGLKETIASAVSAGFKAAGNVKTTVTIRTVTKTYDVDTGRTTKITSDESVSGILTDYSTYEIASGGGLIQSTDRKLIVQTADVTNRPTPDTTMVIISSTTYRIPPDNKMAVGEDPAGATYRIQLRAS